MKIAFIGAGNMATGLGKHWAAKGHELFFSHSRDQDKLKKQAASVSAMAKVGTADEAAEFADVLILTTPYDASPVAIRAAGDLKGKLLWSIVNPLKGDFSGLQVGTTTSGAEELAKLAPESRFVAALPPFAEVLHADRLPDPAPSVFVYSYAARFFEPAMMGLIYLAYGQKMGASIGLRFLNNG